MPNSAIRMNTAAGTVAIAPAFATGLSPTLLVCAVSESNAVQYALSGSPSGISAGCIAAVIPDWVGGEAADWTVLLPGSSVGAVCAPQGFYAAPSLQLQNQSAATTRTQGGGRRRRTALQQNDTAEAEEAPEDLFITGDMLDSEFVGLEEETGRQDHLRPRRFGGGGRRHLSGAGRTVAASDAAFAR